MQTQDLTFITNEPDKTLLNKFTGLIPKYTQYFDCLVGYFYISGFYKLYTSLENVEKIRILVGLGTDKQIAELMNKAREQVAMEFDSVKRAKARITENIATEVEEAEDLKEVEQGILKFSEWVKSGKLEIRVYDKKPLHAKLYIMTFKDDRDPGTVITGSSNLTASGLVDNLEFNVQLREPRDFEYAREKFNELWKDSVDVSDVYIQTINTKTHLNNEITPYQLYLKFLYEYFRADLGLDENLEDDYLPEGYLNLDYQKQAVINAVRILEEYGGVFISDVVGLGKTYISARLANQLDGRTLVIAPPALLDEGNPGSWPNVFYEFGIRSVKFKSIGKLDQILYEGVDGYKNIFIDESHRFRNEATQTYEKLAEICKGKRVVLVSATPFNNTPSDLLSQIKLFQNSRKSTIPNLPDLEGFFSKLNSKLRNLDRKKDYEEYMGTVRDNAKEIRERILKYLMVRRTRTEIKEYYEDDLTKQGLRFPEVTDPEAIYYEFDKEEDKAFQATMEFIKTFKYSRYTPLLYYTGTLSQQELQSQRNMTLFMKMLLIKRFESSLFAFKKTLERFITSYKIMIEEFDKGNVYVSKKNANKLFDLLLEGDEEEILSMIESEKAQEYKTQDFDPKLRDDLEYDLKILEDIYEQWKKIKRDVKLEHFLEVMRDNKILSKSKVIIFTESQETADYLSENLINNLKEKVLNFTGSSSEEKRKEVIENFDAKSKHPKDDYRILVSTEVLAEGVNLHRSNCVVNYDIPWNPTRLIQRVGRINRVDTKFKEIYTFNFFPTTQANDQIKLKEAAEAKIKMFIELLGNDARLLTDGEEIKSHDLFNRLMSKKTITGEDESEDSELKYLKIIKDIRDNNTDLFDQVKRLPKKARSSKLFKLTDDSLLTYFQKGKIDKFIISDTKATTELDFFNATKFMESKREDKRYKEMPDYYDLLKKNKEHFDFLTSQESDEFSVKRGGNTAQKILKRLKTKSIKEFKGFTEDQDTYLKLVIQRLEEGAFPKQTIKNLWAKIQDEANPLKVVSLLKKHLPENLLKSTYVQNIADSNERRAVILSQFLKV